MDARKIRNNLWKKICIISTLIPLTFVQAAEWQLPTALIEKISGLEPQQQSFILTGDALDFLPAMQLIHEIETRDAADIQVMINDLLIVAAEMGYDPTRDMGAIPLSLSGEGFNLGTIIPAPLRKMKRKPGPFSVHRYMFPQSGVQTFAGAKIAIYPEDLVAGDVDVAIIGIPNDMGSGRRNAEYGPRVMRAMNTIATRDVQSLLDPMEVLSVVDYGDFTVDNMSTEKSLAHVTAMVAETAATGAIPIMVGGDTSILYPAVKGLVFSMVTILYRLVCVVKLLTLIPSNGCVQRGFAITPWQKLIDAVTRRCLKKSRKKSIRGRVNCLFLSMSVLSSQQKWSPQVGLFLTGCGCNK
jgi:hypothetical protein